MKIDDVIAELQRIKAERGNLPVRVIVSICDCCDERCDHEGGEVTSVEVFGDGNPGVWIR